jgi:hypothetical protein
MRRIGAAASELQDSRYGIRGILVNISLPADALVCLITTLFISGFFSVVPCAKQRLAAASNVPGTIMPFLSITSSLYTGIVR